MEAIRYIVDNLYSKFLLRDVFGKIVPGFILILSILAMINSPPVSPIYLIEKLTHTWTLGVFLMAIGASWILGFVPQQVLRIKLFGKRILIPSETRTVKFIKIYSAFDYNDKNNAIPKQLMVQRERHAVINEATGNMAIALVPFIIAMVYFYLKNSSFIGCGEKITSIIVFFILVLLWYRHRYSRRRQNCIEDEIIRLSNR